MSKKTKDKFSFTTEYQQELLRSLILDSDVRDIFPLIKESYFTLIEHQLIFLSLSKYFKKNKRVPSQMILQETVLELCSETKYNELVLKEDIDNIKKIIPYLYSGRPDNTDDIKNRALQFISYVRIRDLNNTFDLTDFHQYEPYSKEFNKVLSVSVQHKKERPKSLINEVSIRQLNRKSQPDIIETPFKQINSSTNAGGYQTGSIIVLLDRAKATKTFNLVNVARSYLAKRKPVLIIDNENGEEEYLMRIEQSTLNKTKSELLSGDYDELSRRHFRKYKRLGVDIMVKRVPAMITSANDIKAIMEELKSDFNFVPKVLIVDSAYKLASNDNIKEDHERISQVYIELTNLALQMGIEHIWTAHHVTRSAEKNQSTRYEESDIAKCIDISKHAHAIWGLNYTEEEREQGIQRWELVCQRDGPPLCRAMFYIDLPRQRIKEFNSNQRKYYDDIYNKQKINKPKRIERPEGANSKDI